MPPTRAPIRFNDITLETSRDEASSVEKTIPEKNNGHVSTTIAVILPVNVDENPPPIEIHNPMARLASRNTNGITGLLSANPLTTALDRKAIKSIQLITSPMHCQVFPTTRPNSVIPLVSTSMKPAPRKKNPEWLNRGFSPMKLKTRSAEIATTSAIMGMYENGYMRRGM